VVEVNKILEYAQKQGASEAEVIKDNSKIQYVRFELREPKQTFLGKTNEYALRVVVDGRRGFSYFTSNWEDAVKEAVSLAKSREKDERWTAFVSDRPTKPLNLYHKSAEEVSIEQMIDDMRLICEATEHKHIVASNIDCQLGLSQVEVANTSGVHKKEASSILALRVMCRAADSGYGMGYSYGYSLGHDLDFFRLGEEARENALSQLGKQKIESGDKKVVMAPRVFSNLLICAALPSFLGDNVVEGRSTLHIGKEVASESFHLQENPLVETPSGRICDDEGTPSQTVDLISEKKVKNFLYDNYYGESTASAIRYFRYRGRTLRSPPRPAATSLQIAGNPTPLDELISEVKDGLLVIDETNSHASKPQSGLFSIAVTSGFIIKNGEIASPVKRCMVSGLAFEDLLPNVVLISEEKEFHRSFVYPTYAETGYALIDLLRVTA